MNLPLILKSTYETPEIVLDKSQNTFLINGRSLPEDAVAFYAPVLNWISTYAADPNQKTVLQIELEYMNSASSRQLLELLIRLEEIAKAGNDVAIAWRCHVTDDLMQIRGKEIGQIIELPLEIILFGEE